MFITIDGVKYKVDPSDSTKALLDSEGKMVVFEEPAPAGDKPDLSKLSLEELRKANPEAAKALQDLDDLRKANEDAQNKKQEENDKALQEQGKWQELAESNNKKRKDAEEIARKANETLGKYKDTMGTILENFMQGIPEDKKALIPQDYSPRKKLEYITANATVLGANISPINKGAGIPKSEDKPDLDEEAKLSKEFDELMAKGRVRTPMETQRMMELAKKIKELRTANATK
jgi:hypothetical protein